MLRVLHREAMVSTCTTSMHHRLHLRRVGIGIPTERECVRSVAHASPPICCTILAGMGQLQLGIRWL